MTNFEENYILIPFKFIKWKFQINNFMLSRLMFDIILSHIAVKYQLTSDTQYIKGNSIIFRENFVKGWIRLYGWIIKDQLKLYIIQHIESFNIGQTYTFPILKDGKRVFISIVINDLNISNIITSQIYHAYSQILNKYFIKDEDYNMLMYMATGIAKIR
jgi:hypothetical protein